jgi:DNA-binding MarR family transcriptional regulator
MLSRVLAALVEDGWVQRRGDPDDRRVSWVGVTAAGRRLAERVRRERTEALNRAMSALPERQRREIEKTLPGLEALAEALADVRP